MFYDKFLDLCNLKGKKPGAVAAELGINRCNVTSWKKNGYTPRGEVLQRIADYFSVSVDELLRVDTPQDHSEQENTASFHKEITLQEETSSMSFYDIFLDLCNRICKKPSAVASELGINKSNVSNWKNNGYTPRGEVLQRIADYFSVSVDELLGVEHPSSSDEEELAEYLDELKNRKEMRMLFKLSKGCTKEEVEQAVRIIEALRRND